MHFSSPSAGVRAVRHDFFPRTLFASRCVGVRAAAGENKSLALGINKLHSDRNRHSSRTRSLAQSSQLWIYHPQGYPRIITLQRDRAVKLQTIRSASVNIISLQGLLRQSVQHIITVTLAIAAK